MPIRTEIADNIAEVIFDHPPVNAFNGQMWNEIPAIVTSLGKRQDVKVVLIRAEGKGFCAGVDIKELADNSAAIVGVNKGNYETGKTIHQCEVPVICAPHGYIIGGGVIMCGAADIVIASDDAYCSLPEIDRAAMGGAAYLQRMLPLAKVRAAFLTGGQIPASEAYRLGGIEKVVSKADLYKTARENHVMRFVSRNRHLTVSSHLTLNVLIVGNKASHSRCICTKIAKRPGTPLSKLARRQILKSNGC